MRRWIVLLVLLLAILAIAILLLLPQPNRQRSNLPPWCHVVSRSPGGAALIECANIGTPTR